MENTQIYFFQAHLVCVLNLHQSNICIKGSLEDQTDILATSLPKSY